jgi:SAM-dependent methyltransferase
LPPPQHASFIANLAVRERYREEYWRAHDPIADDRVLWRAQAVRHTVHLLPGQTILELGCGDGRFTRALLRVSRNQNPITAVTFQSSVADNSPSDSKVELLQLSEFPGQLKGRRFDYIVAMDLLDRTTSSELLESVYELLTPGGEMVFYESNPWNPVHKLRALVLRLFGKRDPRNLINKPNLYELLSELGFVRIYAVFNDFVFAPLTRPLIWFLRNASILLENTPGLRTMAGSILIHAQKPPRRKELPVVSLFEHESLRGAVSVVIPSHNEEMNIRPLVERILTLYGEYIHEIIPVNDGSKDRTGEVINDLAAKDNRMWCF